MRFLEASSLIAVTVIKVKDEIARIGEARNSPLSLVSHHAGALGVKIFGNFLGGLPKAEENGAA